MKDYKAMAEEERPVLTNRQFRYVTFTPDVDQFDKGDMKGDMGPIKALTALVPTQ